MITKFIRKLLGRPDEVSPASAPSSESRTAAASSVVDAADAGAVRATDTGARPAARRTSGAAGAVGGSASDTSGQVDSLSERRPRRGAAPRRTRRPDGPATAGGGAGRPNGKENGAAGVEARPARRTPRTNAGVNADAPASAYANALTNALTDNNEPRPVRSTAARAEIKAAAVPGVTMTEASDATAAAAHGDLPVVVPVDVHGIDASLISRNAVRVTDTLQQAGHRAFIVGGAVRDLLFGVAPKDFDVATDATPDQVQRLFRRARIIGRRFQIVHVQFGQDLIEVSTFRALVDPAGPADVAGVLPAATAVSTDIADAGTASAVLAESVSPQARTSVQAEDDLSRHDDTLDDAHDEGDDDDLDHADDDTSGPDGTHGADGRDKPRGDGRGPDGRRRRRRREDPDRRQHAVDASGRVLRDNVWGEQHEDARRRDFTINAMYYDPSTQTVLDYHDGMADMRARTLRMIGDPAARYREDPVRMLRVVRFAAKLGFEIEPLTRAPIAEMAGLLNNVPAARIFDELLKLLLSGHALACLRKLRTEGLHRDLLPLLDSALDTPHSEKFMTLSLTNTDERIRAGKSVSPGFLFAALLWHQTQRRWQHYISEGELAIPALHHAMDDVLNAQNGRLAIQRRFVSDMKEIWGMQPRLEKQAGRSALKLLEHPKFRAAYDFLLLRCESEELDPALGRWWTAFVQGDYAAREALLNTTTPKEGAPRSRSRSRRRRGKGAGQDGGSATNAANVAGSEGGEHGSDRASTAGQDRRDPHASHEPQD